MGRSRMSILKRQRELKKVEKAAMKRAKRHGTPEIAFIEPRPTVSLSAPEESPDSTEETGEPDKPDETDSSS